MSLDLLRKTLTSLVFFVAFAASALANPETAERPEFEEDFTLPIVYLNLVIDAGVAHDPKDKLGLANIANKMLLRGTRLHTKAQFNELLNRLGGELEVDVREEGTVIRGAVLSENLERFLELFEEALVKPRFAADELSKLKKEVEGMILAAKGNDKSLLQLNHYRFFYGSHPYGNPNLGTRATVAKIGPKDVVGYYNRFYGAPTMRLFGTGAAKKEILDAWFNRVTEKLTALHPEASKPAPIAAPLIPQGRRALLVNKPKASQSQVFISGTGIRPEHPGYYPIMLANYSFGGHSFQARMMQEIRVKRGWTYGASNAFRYGSQPRHYSMYFFPKTADTVPAIGLAIDMLQQFVNQGITREEFNFARAALVNNAPFNFDTSKKRLENAVVEYLFRFPRGYYRDFAQNIGKVEYPRIAPALQSFFDVGNLTMTVVGDAASLKDPMSKVPGFGLPKAKSYLED